MTDARYLSCAETAKLVRAALKRNFPRVKFSVRSSTYSGGASIDVQWTDGPAFSLVEPILKQYERSRFDSSIDMAISRSSWLLPDGRAIVAKDPGTAGQRGSLSAQSNAKPHAGAVLVRFGADYVTGRRDHTPRLVARVLAKLEAGGMPVGLFAVGGREDHAYLEMQQAMVPACPDWHAWERRGHALTRRFMIAGA